MAISSPEMMLVPRAESDRSAAGAESWKRTEVDVTERTATDLAANAVLITDAEVLQRGGQSGSEFLHRWQAAG